MKHEAWCESCLTMLAFQYARRAVKAMMNALSSSSCKTRLSKPALMHRCIPVPALCRADASRHRGLYSPSSDLISSLSSASITGQSSTISENGSQVSQPIESEFQDVLAELMVMDVSSMIPLFSGPRQVIRWYLSCGHTIVCDCPHHVGERVFCSNNDCRTWQYMMKWEQYDPGKLSPAT